eukprot:4690097-Amphidinium_carterae.1
MDRLEQGTSNSAPVAAGRPTVYGPTVASVPSAAVMSASATCFQRSRRLSRSARVSVEQRSHSPTWSSTAIYSYRCSRCASVSECLGRSPNTAWTRWTRDPMPGRSSRTSAQCGGGHSRGPRAQCRAHASSSRRGRGRHKHGHSAHDVAASGALEQHQEGEGSTTDPRGCALWNHRRECRSRVFSARSLQWPFLERGADFASLAEESGDQPHSLGLFGRRESSPGARLRPDGNAVEHADIRTAETDLPSEARTPSTHVASPVSLSCLESDGKARGARLGDHAGAEECGAGHPCKRVLANCLGSDGASGSCGAQPERPFSSSRTLRSDSVRQGACHHGGAVEKVCECEPAVKRAGGGMAEEETQGRRKGSRPAPESELSIVRCPSDSTLATAAANILAARAEMKTWSGETLRAHLKKLLLERSVPRHHSRRNVGKAPRSILFGLYTRRGLGIGKETVQRLELLAALHELASRRPAPHDKHGYVAIMLNCNDSLSRHRDEFNWGLNYIYGLHVGGQSLAESATPVSGGELWVSLDPEEPPARIHAAGEFPIDEDWHCSIDIMRNLE